MKLKTFFIGALLIVVSFSSKLNAQSDWKQKALTHVIYNENVNAPLTVKERAQLKEAYGDEFETYVLKHTQYLKDLKNLLRNRIVVEEIPELIQHKKKYNLLSEIDYRNSSKTHIDAFSVETFNPLLYNLPFFSRGGAVYRIDNTNYFIVIKSQYFN